VAGHWSTADGQLPVLLLDPGLEEEIISTVAPETSGVGGGQRQLAASARPATPIVRRLGRFCEIAYRFRILLGPARASLPQSGPFFRPAMAGTGVAAPGGGCGQ